MFNGFYVKLAINNLKKNASLYLPFISMNIMVIAMFYILHAIAISEGTKAMAGGTSLKMVLGFGVVVIGIFSVIALLYTNSFLMKRRQKEIGLFNVLGMGKRHLARVIGLETLIIAGVCIVLGIITGIVFSKLMFMLLLRLLSYPMTLSFALSYSSMLLSAMVFGAIFTLMLLVNLKNIHLSKPIELIKGSAVGEKEPKSKIFLAFVGAISLISGYVLALSVKSPLDAMGTFFIAVVLVIIGTYALFTTVSIVVLKRLRSNSKFYYKIENFTLVSGMLYRMKRNAVGISNICILSTMVVISLSTTFSMYMGMEDLANQRYPKEVSIRVQKASIEKVQSIRTLFDKAQEVKNQKLSNYSELEYSILFTRYNQDIYKSTDEFYQNEMHMFQLITEDTYESLSGASLDLSDGQVAVLNIKGDYNETHIPFGNKRYEIIKSLDSVGTIKKDERSFIPMRLVVLRDKQAVMELVAEMTGEAFEAFDYTFEFDIEGSESEKKAFSQWLNGGLSEQGLEFSYDSKSLSIESFLSMYGGLFFIGLFLGTLFLLATVMIMYYKQISEGYEDKSRFEIMQKVGMTHQEIKKSIRAQTVGVFFMPLLLMCVHIAFAFNVISRLLALFNFYNTPLFIACTFATVIVFGLFYYAIYRVTARSYFKIVKWS